MWFNVSARLGKKLVRVACQSRIGSAATAEQTVIRQRVGMRLDAQVGASIASVSALAGFAAACPPPVRPRPSRR